MMDFEHEGVWSYPMKQVMKEIIEIYHTNSRRRDVAYITLGMCCEWAEYQECEEYYGGIARFSDRAAKKSLKTYVKTGWEKLNSNSNLAWAESVLLWFVMKFVVPWVIRRFLKNLNKQ